MTLKHWLPYDQVKQRRTWLVRRWKSTWMHEVLMTDDKQLEIDELSSNSNRDGYIDPRGK